MTVRHSTEHETPRACVGGWLRDIGADHVTLTTHDTNRSYTVDYALAVLDDLAPTHARIYNFELRAILFRGLNVIGELRTPTARGDQIWWEKL